MEENPWWKPIMEKTYDILTGFFSPTSSSCTRVFTYLNACFSAKWLFLNQILFFSTSRTTTCVWLSNFFSHFLDAVYSFSFSMHLIVFATLNTESLLPSTFLYSNCDLHLHPTLSLTSWPEPWAVVQNCCLLYVSNQNLLYKTWFLSLSLRFLHN